MNEELSSLLIEAGVQGSIDWRDVIVVQNYVGLDTRPDSDDGGEDVRGFNFVVLSEGLPAFFGKCRPADDAVLERETAIRSCLAGRRPNGLSIPTAKNASSDRMTIQIGPFIRGSNYGHVAPKQSAKDFLDTMRTAVVGAAQLADLALMKCREDGIVGGSVDLRRQTDRLLEFTAPRVALDDRLVAALCNALSDASTVPSRPQHGDLWYQNLLVAENLLWAIDLEHYGTVCCPLYDDLTLLRSVIRHRPGPGLGVPRLMGPDPESVACRQLLVERAIAEGIQLGKLDGILVYYVLHRAHIVSVRAGAMLARQYLDDVRYVAQRLADGQRDLLVPR